MIMKMQELLLLRRLHDVGLNRWKVEEEKHAGFQTLPRYSLLHLREEVSFVCGVD